MATQQYAQETTPQNNGIKENEASLDKRKSSSETTNEYENNTSDGFNCNICLDFVQDPVVTLCGHLYCWPCIYKWIHHQNTSSKIPNKHNPQCPVCKTKISQNTLVPLYVPNETTKPHCDKSTLDFGMLIPKRPLSSSCGVNIVPTQQLNYHGYPQQPFTSSLTTTMYGEMVYDRIFGNTQSSFYAYPNSYGLAAISTQRARRHAMKVDTSLGRVWFFLFCCVLLCVLLF